ncbi:molecular chaperone [Vibrio sp. OCN044]|uniref:Molecular chaperone n=1 Tax=Vibrio tetraodonis subsp. pristinus TaxID=2695891 RepID=A0A6L8LSG6_9VIBR|nr:molecular chaperone [Vibrio tetraodonis]MYM59054.1 molecular chaperone [Vibrio tetraodonis subsp. pristinus]
MAVGFDYGTANCSVSEFINTEIIQVPLTKEGCYLPSTLSAPNTESVSEYLFKCKGIKPEGDVGEALLRRAIKHNKEEGLVIHPEDLQFGDQAFDSYLADPRDTYFVKSPKSFLGVMGLRDGQLAFFEDLVCAMMVNIKNQTENHLQKSVTQAVIGRPVNFLGRGGQDSNRQAEGILRRAAGRAGFKEVEFQFEPLAAGIDYEANLTSDKNVLVVDIGGGTTDCSFVQMGPSWRDKHDRSESLIAHTGQRVGGNDLDIYTAFKCFMHEFGMGSPNTMGLDVPITQFWNPIAINDVQAQRQFYSQENYKQLKLLSKQVSEQHNLLRLLEVHQGTLGYAIVREAEQAKISLSNQTSCRAEIQLIKEMLCCDITRGQVEQALSTPIEKMTALVTEAIKQGSTNPDVIYLTGGSARSPIITKAIESMVPNTPVVGKDYFGSVTSGLARWAALIFK